MKVYKCDVCGAIYGNAEKRELTGAFSNIVITIFNEVGKDLQLDDICEPCQTAIVDYINCLKNRPAVQKK